MNKIEISLINMIYFYSEENVNIFCEINNIPLPKITIFRVIDDMLQ